MKIISRRGFLQGSLSASAGALVLSRSTTPVHAQPYPSRPIRMVVPFAPGGTTDFVGRVMSDKMSEFAGQRFFVENKTGAAGAIGMRDVAGAAADGYTVLMGDTTMAITPTLNPAAGIDPFKMFQPIGLVAVFPSVLVVHPSVPAKTVADLVAHARQNPNKVNFGSGGIGTPPHLQGEQFRLKTGTAMQHVPYRGAAAALQDVVAGQIQMLFTAGPTAAPFIEGGQLRLIATTGAERLPMAKETPTLREQGVDFVSAQWFGLSAPAKTPAPIVMLLSEWHNQALRDAGVARRITEQGGFLKPGSPEDFTRFIESEIAAWGEIVRSANVTQ